MIDFIGILIETEEAAINAVKLLNDTLDKGSVHIKVDDLKKIHDYLFAIQDRLNKIRACIESNKIEEIEKVIKEAEKCPTKE